VSDEHNELRERAVLPVLLPVAAILLTEVLVFSMSRVLLATGGQTAVAIALGTALAILLGATMIANAPKASTGAIMGLLTVVALGVVVAGAVAYAHGPVYPKEKAGAAAEAVAVSASNVKFSVKEIALPASGASIDFSNQDTQPHNIAIFPSAKQLTTPLFRGTIVQPGQKATYDVGNVKPGSYYFHCDVHPTQMFGSVVVK
jgi:plastocyanin